jgi:predicted dehydrogenase
MSRNPNLGIVGCGTIADLLLSGARSAEIAVRAVCDVDEARARRAAHPFDATVYTDYDRMLSDASLDAVIIALPTHMHCDAASKALAAGKHVFCEKTMTNKLRDSRRLVLQALDSGKVFQMGYMKRFNPAFAAVKSRLDQIAPITNATFRLTIAADPLLDGRPAQPSSWHGDMAKVGGGFLVHSGSHLLDLMIHYFGLPDCAWGSLARDRNGNEYTNNFLFRMQGGLPVNLQLFMTRARGFGYAGSVWEERVDITGLNGRLSAEDADWMGSIPSRAYMHLADGDGPKSLFTLWQSQWAEELKAFCEGICQGKCLGSSAVDGYHVDYLLDRLKKFEAGSSLVHFKYDL